MVLVNERMLELHRDTLMVSLQKFPEQKAKIVFAKGDERVKAARCAGLRAKAG